MGLVDGVGAMRHQAQMQRMLRSRYGGDWFYRVDRLDDHDGFYEDVNVQPQLGAKKITMENAAEALDEVYDLLEPYAIYPLFAYSYAYEPNGERHMWGRNPRGAWGPAKYGPPVEDVISGAWTAPRPRAAVAPTVESTAAAVPRPKPAEPSEPAPAASISKPQPVEPSQHAPLLPERPPRRRLDRDMAAFLAACVCSALAGLLLRFEPSGTARLLGVGLAIVVGHFGYLLLTGEGEGITMDEGLAVIFSLMFAPIPAALIVALWGVPTRF